MNPSTSEHYVLKITSLENTEKSVSFYGSYFTGAAGSALVTHINETTPFELHAKADIFGCMINANMDMPNAKFKLEIMKVNDKTTLVSGIGRSHLAHVKGDKSYIYSN